MDDQRFDRLAKAVATVGTRRGVMAGLAGAALGAALGVPRPRHAAAATCPNVRCSGPSAQPCPDPCICVVFGNGNNRCLTPTASTCRLKGQVLCGGTCVDASCPGGGTPDPTTCACPNAAPTCTVTLNDPGPPARIEQTVQDTGSGLVSIVVTKSENADTVVPPFIPGTTEPVVVSSTKIDQTQVARVEMNVTDGAGNSRTCSQEF